MKEREREESRFVLIVFFCRFAMILRGSIPAVLLRLLFKLRLFIIR